MACASRQAKRFKPTAAAMSMDKCNELEDEERTNVWAPQEKDYVFQDEDPGMNILFECLA